MWMGWKVLTWSPSLNEHRRSVLHVKSNWAQWWGLVGRGQESFPAPDAGLPRRVGQ